MSEVFWFGAGLLSGCILMTVILVFLTADGKEIIHHHHRDEHDECA
jgi:hypothetical protein